MKRSSSPRCLRAIRRRRWRAVHSRSGRRSRARRNEKGVTLHLLWQEYRQGEPEGYSYSQFAELYRRWRGTLDPVLRQEYQAGERAFVDYAGMTVEVIDPATGEVRTAQIFVAALGASNYTYGEATWTQQLPDWIASHVRMLEFFGGVPALMVPGCQIAIA